MQDIPGLVVNEKLIFKDLSTSPMEQGLKDLCQALLESLTCSHQKWADCSVYSSVFPSS